MLEVSYFFFNDTATTEIYTLSLHDALPICRVFLRAYGGRRFSVDRPAATERGLRPDRHAAPRCRPRRSEDRKSTRLNSSHANISYAVFCLKKKKMGNEMTTLLADTHCASRA